MGRFARCLKDLSLLTGDIVYVCWLAVRALAKEFTR